MGAISQMMIAATDAINELGRKDDSINDGYHFKHDSSTWSADDVTIRADGDEFVLAIVWKNLKGYKPSLPNLAHAFENYGWAVRDKSRIDKLEKEEKLLKDIVETMKRCVVSYEPNHKMTDKLVEAEKLIGGEE